MARPDFVFAPPTGVEGARSLLRAQSRGVGRSLRPGLGGIPLLLRLARGDLG
jgi:hypothetical protein